MPRSNLCSVGDRYGRWTLLSLAAPENDGSRRWLCRCECGTEKIVSQSTLRNHMSQSCGCLRDEKTAANGHATKTHGESAATANTPEYQAFAGMIARCENSANPAYGNYGGRGISVCQQWRNSYQAFLADVGRKPSPAHSLDRYPNNNGNYEPGNVRWATRSEQAINRRTTHLITFNDRTLTITEWAAALRIKPMTLYARIFVYEWPVGRAMATPCRRMTRRLYAH